MRVRIVTELSCYMDNQPGMLAKIAQELADKGISVKGIQSFDGQLQSLVRLVVDKPDVAEQILRDFGVDLISRPEVMEVLIKNEVGGLAEVTTLLGQHDMNINSLYSTDGLGTYGMAYIRVDDVEKATEMLNSRLPHFEGISF